MTVANVPAAVQIIVNAGYGAQIIPPVAPDTQWRVRAVANTFAITSAQIDFMVSQGLTATAAQVEFV